VDEVITGVCNVCLAAGGSKVPCQG